MLNNFAESPSFGVDPFVVANIQSSAKKYGIILVVLRNAVPRSIAKKSMIVLTFVSNSLIINDMDSLFSNPESLKSLFEAMSDGLMVIDKDSNILFFDRAAEDMTGYQREEIVWKKCSTLDNKSCSYKKQAGNYKKCMLFENVTMSGTRCHLHGKDGREVHLLKNAVLLKNTPGDFIGAVEVMTDVTSLDMKNLEIKRLKNEFMHEYGFMGLLGTSPSMQRFYELIRNAAESEAPVLISGESGTGKELVTAAIHKLSRRNKGSFIKINCAALNEFLLESALFGHVRGAFTGAIRDRQGRLEIANEGSIFLDESGYMPPSIQVKLLRVVQEKVLDRVGDNRTVSVDVRLIAATNKDLSSLMESGNFREDLFYHVNVIPVNTPKLRERLEDLPILVSHFLERISSANGKGIKRRSPAAMEALKNYPWPGSVRQLINALKSAVSTCKGDTIALSELPDYLLKRGRGLERSVTTKNHRERSHVISVLKKFDDNLTLSARHLGISRFTLGKIIKALHIDRVLQFDSILTLGRRAA